MSRRPTRARPSSTCVTPTTRRRRPRRPHCSARRRGRGPRVRRPSRRCTSRRRRRQAGDLGRPVAIPPRKATSSSHCGRRRTQHRRRRRLPAAIAKWSSTWNSRSSTNSSSSTGRWSTPETLGNERFTFLSARRYASVGTSYGPVSVCLSVYVTSRCSIKRNERINMVLGMEPFIDQSYTVF